MMQIGRMVTRIAECVAEDACLAMEALGNIADHVKGNASDDVLEVAERLYRIVGNMARLLSREIAAEYHARILDGSERVGYAIEAAYLDDHLKEAE